MHLATYLGLLDNSLRTLADAFRQVGSGHADEPDVENTCQLLAGRTDAQIDTLAPIIDRYGEHREEEPERLHATGLSGTRGGPVGLLRDLQDLYLLAALVDLTWTVVHQAAQALRDHELLNLTTNRQSDTDRQLGWLRTRIKQAAPQALIAAR
ncbi:MAG: hypothetical protein ACJ72N_17830 [Labedaea sp.]